MMLTGYHLLNPGDMGDALFFFLFNVSVTLCGQYFLSLFTDESAVSKR